MANNTVLHEQSQAVKIKVVINQQMINMGLDSGIHRT